MAAIRIKICGIRDASALDAAVDAGADWIGLQFFPRSPRCIDAETAAALHHRLRGRIPAVGLFVDPTEDDIAGVLATTPLDVLQLYGATGRAAEIRRRFGVPVWLAHGVATPADLPATTDAAGLVIEAKPPPGSDRPGGNGARFDWRVLRGWTAPAPWMLAGGLTPDNVGTALEASGADAVDVSSGVERAPGEKDPDLIRAFIAAARAGQSVIRSNRLVRSDRDARKDNELEHDP